MKYFIPVQILFALFIALALSCAKPTQTEINDFEKAFAMKVGNVDFQARIAYFENEKMRGLMFVKNLPENLAMIFVYDTPQRASFWMKNTFIELDLAFFDKDGMLIEVKKLYPHNLDAVQSSSDQIAYCMEANAAWFEKNNIKSGDKLDLKLLNNAINLRKKSAE